MGAGDLAALLRELKERSGLSYGALAKRLHMSTSTLHRYVNGTAVPTEFAPVERFARACRAAPEELVEVHRRWIVADAARGRRGAEKGPQGPVPEPERVPPAGPEQEAESRSEPLPEPAADAEAGTGAAATAPGGTAPVPYPDRAADEPDRRARPHRRQPPGRRRTAPQPRRHPGDPGGPDGPPRQGQGRPLRQGRPGPHRHPAAPVPRRGRAHPAAGDPAVRDRVSRRGDGARKNRTTGPGPRC
ncbi:hypothetical protein P354_17455 [Streptomyces noursei PD-1]|nr:hypothetical protein P354_17455 [Streptomyces noursei PD-1]